MQKTALHVHEFFLGLCRLTASGSVYRSRNEGLHDSPGITEFGAGPVELAHVPRCKMILHRDDFVQDDGDLLLAQVSQK